MNSKSDWYDRTRWLDNKSRPLIWVGVGASLLRPLLPRYWISPSGPATNRRYAALGSMTERLGVGLQSLAVQRCVSDVRTGSVLEMQMTESHLPIRLLGAGPGTYLTSPLDAP